MNTTRSFIFKNHCLIFICVCEKILSNDKVSTGLDDKLDSSHIIVSLNPKRFPIVSLNTKPVIGPCWRISIILPIVLTFGDILNGYSTSA